MSSALLVSLAVIAAAPHRTQIVVLDVQDQSGQYPLLAKQLTQVVAAEVARVPGASSISSEGMRQALGLEKQRQLLGCNESSCLAEIGAALGAEYLVTASLGRIGSRFRFDVRLIRALNASTVASAGDFVAGSEDALADAAVSMTDQVLAAAHLGGPARGQAAAAAAAPAAEVKAPAERGPSRTSAYVLWGAAGALAAGATVMTVMAHNTFQDAVQNHADPSSLSWKSPLADGLWGAALVTAGVGTYFYFSASPSPGGGGAVAVGGSF